MNDCQLMLRSKEIFPTEDLLQEILKSSFDTYMQFRESLEDVELEQEWHWFSPHKVWAGRGQYRWITTRGTEKEKTLYWLYVNQGCFTVEVWFLEKNRSIILNSDVSNETKQLIRDGKTWDGLNTFPVTFKISTPEPLKDLFTLIKHKKTLEK